MPWGCKCKPAATYISVRWLPPPMHFIKINTDGSEVKGRIQGGAVYRDSMGFVVAAFLRKMGKGRAFEAEILAAMERVSAAIMKGWSKIVLESDSTYVVSLFNNNDSEIPWKYRANWDWLSEKIREIEFVAMHVYREGNKVADAISTYDTKDDFIWWDNIPNFILNLAARDRHMEYFRIR